MGKHPLRMACWTSFLLLACAPAARADGPPDWLPRYDVDINLDVRQHLVTVLEKVAWTNRSDRAVSEIVFNAHAAYSIPDKDIGLLAKMVEILRMAPSEAMSFDGPPLKVQEATLLAINGKEPASGGREPPEVGPAQSRGAHARRSPGVAVPFRFAPDNQTALVVPLPEPIKPGQTATVQLQFTIKLPQKKGRWGQWDGVTTLAQWLPVVAVHGDKGFDPAPFIPWHQPFHNEAGFYNVRVTLPCDQVLAASACEKGVADLGDGRRLVEFEPICSRDFTMVCSSRFKEWVGESDGVKVRCLAFKEHEFYAKVLLDAACEAIPVYNGWFGRYPYPQFTVVEACFGWNGNECGGLVMVDDRMFRMPHIAKSYPTYLIQHELCHQWFYNVVGTNGYCETWMDEGPATYFSHRLANSKIGPNNKMLNYPTGLGWMPNIHREDLRNYSMVGAHARGELKPAVQKMEDYGHLVNLTAATYDRGSKIVGMIEERMGETAFFEFMRHIYAKYQYRILRVADFQRELEAMTGRPWDEFFQHWVREPGMCDWSVQRVEIDDRPAWKNVFHSKKKGEPVKVVVYLKQEGGFNEPTTLGVQLDGSPGYQIRIPIFPDMPVFQMDDPPTTVECQTRSHPTRKRENGALVRVEMCLPSTPTQISVDPDGVLLDERPTNNHWKMRIRWHPTPLYTQLDDVDVTNAYDRWNVNCGPWVFMSSYNDPWFTRSAMGGLRVGVYRTQEYMGGAYLAYRADDRNIIVGGDSLWDHTPFPHTQVGFTVERSIATLGDDVPYSRGVVFGRYVMMYSSSLYLPPFEYVEGFGSVQNRGLPMPRTPSDDADLFGTRPTVGMHYHKNLLTPYWNPEGGLAFDATYQYGMPLFGNQVNFQQVSGQLSFVKGMPRVLDWMGDNNAVSWLNDTRWAFRLGGGAALPTRGEFYSLGGGDKFRGFDLAERQGNAVWVGSVEWRIPLARGLDWDVCDHVAGLRSAYVAPFYDVGDAYLRGQQLGTVAHAVGAGLRLDVIWLGLIERTTLRFDVAKTLNSTAPMQIWFGIAHPF